MNKKLILKKEDIKIELRLRGKKVSILYEFADAQKDNLEDYNYLLDRIQSYLKSGEYSVENQGLDAPISP